MTVYIADPDFTLYVGDVGDVLPTLADESVDCVITSPPYWGLRDYGTGAWDGGNPDCDHLDPGLHEDTNKGLVGMRGPNDGPARQYTDGTRGGRQYRDTCGRCGARRVDRQLGLEATPDLFVTRMVAVFREVRRVLAPHGTCWVNLGDSYGGGALGRNDAGRNFTGGGGNREGSGNPGRQGVVDIATGLKPKDLVGIPWRVAFALQADGWYLRADIIWAKPNPMPESVTDRPTKAHEYVFLLTKQPRYWFDAEAVREPHREPGRVQVNSGARYDSGVTADGVKANAAGTANGYNPAGRNVRSVWDIATQPYPEAHFATYPEELVRRCLLAGCPEWVCRTCGKPRERIVERTLNPVQKTFTSAAPRDGFNKNPEGHIPATQTVETVGWSDCGHNNYRAGIVLDPFLGSGTTALIARRHGRHTVGIELSTEYAELAARRLQQLSLLAEEAPA